MAIAIGAESQLSLYHAFSHGDRAGASLADCGEGCYEAETWGQLPYPEARILDMLPVHSKPPKNDNEIKQENLPPQRRH